MTTFSNDSGSDSGTTPTQPEDDASDASASRSDTGAGSQWVPRPSTFKVVRLKDATRSYMLAEADLSARHVREPVDRNEIPADYPPPAPSGVFAVEEKQTFEQWLDSPGNDIEPLDNWDIYKPSPSHTNGWWLAQEARLTMWRDNPDGTVDIHIPKATFAARYFAGHPQLGDDGKYFPDLMWPLEVALLLDDESLLREVRRNVFFALPNRERGKALRGARRDGESMRRMADRLGLKRSTVQRAIADFPG